MKPGKLFSRLRSQKGFTMVEVAVSILILAIISLGATMTNVQVIEQTSRNSDYTTAGRQTLNAMHWISNDVQMAQSFQLEGASGFPLALGWVEWDNSMHEVVYSIVGTTLQRNYQVDDGTPQLTTVAYHISPDAALTNCSLANGVLTLTITGSVGSGENETRVTRVQEIASRPKLR